MSDQIRRNMPLFSIGMVTKLTQLTPRQIRYYEQQQLIHPERTAGNQRLFSFRDVDGLLQIKSWLEKGINMAGIKELLSKNNSVSLPMSSPPTPLSSEGLRKLLKRQSQQLAVNPRQDHLLRGELSRFLN